MTKYILFSFGERSVKNTQQILNVVGKVSNTDTILYQLGTSHLNVQFTTDKTSEEVTNYLNKSLDGLTESHHLSISDNMSDKNDKMIKILSTIFEIDSKEQSLTDVLSKAINKKREENEGFKKLMEESEIRTKEINDEVKKLWPNIDFTDTKDKEPNAEDITFIEKLDSVISNFISNNKGEEMYCEATETENTKEEEVFEYNVDDILDKINEKGLSSLTKNELNFLNSLSK